MAEADVEVHAVDLPADLFKIPQKEIKSLETDIEGHAVDLIAHEFKIPQKEIKSPDQIATVWEKSKAYHDLLGLIVALSSQVKGKKLRDEFHVSEAVEKLLALFATLDKWIDETPPIDQPQRFGNKAFRDWFTKLQENAEGLLREALGEQYERAVPEVSVYLVEGMGNSTRIDYGTGHELAFVAFLCCLFKIGVFKEEDSVAVVLKVFNRYIELVRKLQSVYRMEPAGSQGVWSLDDYQFVAFIWGSAQLIDHPRLKPKHFVEEDMCHSFYRDYMFLGCIKYIIGVKTGPFAEHSNQLWNISAVPLWSKVNSGLIKMYKNEILNKFPVIQHFVFGSLMSIEPAVTT